MVSQKEKAISLYKEHRDQTYLGQAIFQEIVEKVFPGKGKSEVSL